MEERLAAFLQSKMPKASDIQVVGLRRVPGGAAQETWFMDVSWLEGGQRVEKKLVMRRSQLGSSLATDRVTEFRVLQSLGSSRVPVPQVYWAEGGSDWLERPFFIMEHLEGETDFVNIAPPERKRAVAMHFVESLAALHTLDWQKANLAFLQVPQMPEECAEQEIDKWYDIYMRDEMEPQPLLMAEFAWLRAHKPKKVERTSLLWGDPGPGNFVFNGNKVSGLVDWELAHLGDPMDDLGFLVWRSRGARQVMDRHELLETYERFSGLKVNEESLRYYEILANVKVAVMVNTATRNYCQGKTVAPHLAFVGLSLLRNGQRQAADLIGL